MKFKLILLAIVVLHLTSCTNLTNSPEFIKTTTGKYLYNSDEIIEVYFEDSEMFLKWRGATKISPLKLDKNTFFVKEMNEKISFAKNSETSIQYLEFVPKSDIDTVKHRFRKLSKFEKIPSEYLNENNFEKALEGYLAIQKKDSLDKSLNEKNFNSLGYKALRNKKIEMAKNIFKINIELYPNSSNVYDSYGDALKVSGDTLQAIVFYKKSLALDSGNKSAKKFIKKYDITIK